MIYQAYDAIRRSTRPMAKLLDMGQKVARNDRNPWRDTLTMRTLGTVWELQARSLQDYPKQRYEVWEDLGDMEIVVDAHVADRQPFGNLLNFNLEDGQTKPKVLIVAALSGHHATLLVDTIRGFVQDFDTYITDWHDMREVPKEEGDFGFDVYVGHIVKFIEAMGPGVHVVATCQAAPPAMVAASILADRNPKVMPASLTLMGGPVDTRVTPIGINKLAAKFPIDLLKTTNIHTIPKGYPGSGRRVYPGFFQLTGFISLNPKPHFRQYWNFLKNGIKGDDESLQKFRDFYDEYFAVLDMDEKFYLETLQKVFMEHHIPTGQMTYEGELVDFAAVDDLALLTVEGANDNFCPPGQTEAAHGIFSGIPDALKKNYIQEGVGHYGVFSGSKFQKSIYPVIRDWIKEHDTQTMLVPVEA
ncbi:MAG: polyhydroxyalkanoate depolymerase [Novosphingobium sp.]|nr:polyhydroxyalkanoate depolymerase [Novosphingobium sp.]